MQLRPPENAYQLWYPGVVPVALLMLFSIIGQPSRLTSIDFNLLSGKMPDLFKKEWTFARDALDSDFCRDFNNKTFR